MSSITKCSVRHFRFSARFECRKQEVLHLIGVRQRAVFLKKSLRLYERKIYETSRLIDDVRNKQLNELICLSASSKISALSVSDQSDASLKGIQYSMRRHRVRSLETNSSRHRNRLGGLSAIYLEKVSELLASGEVFPRELVDSNIRIVKLQISGNTRRVYVFWSVCSDTASSTSKVTYLQQLLDRSAVAVRHALSQSCHSSVLPPFQFVYDTGVDRVTETLRLLSQVDFGPDHRPADPTHSNTHHPTALQPARLIRERSRMLDGLTSTIQSSRMSSSPAPDESATSVEKLNHTAGDGNAAGLPRAPIVVEILANMRKSSAEHRHPGIVSFPEVVNPDQHRRAMFQRAANKRSRDIKRQLSVAKWMLDADMASVVSAETTCSDSAYSPESDYDTEDSQTSPELPHDGL